MPCCTAPRRAQAGPDACTARIRAMLRLPTLFQNRVGPKRGLRGARITSPPNAGVANGVQLGREALKRFLCESLAYPAGLRARQALGGGRRAGSSCAARSNALLQGATDRARALAPGEHCCSRRHAIDPGCGPQCYCTHTKSDAASPPLHRSLVGRLPVENLHCSPRRCPRRAAPTAPA